MAAPLRLEIGTFSKTEKQGSLAIPGSAVMNRYEAAGQSLSLVQTYEGGEAPTTLLRLEVITRDGCVTAGRPNYRVVVDIPVEGDMGRVIRAAARRSAEAHAGVQVPDALGLFLGTRLRDRDCSESAEEITEES